MATRREVLAGALSVLFARHAAAQGRIFRLAYLSGSGAEPHSGRALFGRLAELGYREGQNLVVDRRFAEGRLDRLPALAAELVAIKPDTLSCFDRLLIKGHLPLGYPRAMEEFLDRHGVLFKQLKPFVLRQAERLKRHARAVAAEAGRPWEYLEGPVRKDQHARAIAARDGVTEGLVCVFGTIEPCRSFRLAYQHGRPAIRPARRKCLFLYFYFVDREFGFRHLQCRGVMTGSCREDPTMVVWPNSPLMLDTLCPPSLDC
jgi:hypothetical protein